MCVYLDWHYIYTTSSQMSFLKLDLCTPCYQVLWLMTIGLADIYWLLHHSSPENDAAYKAPIASNFLWTANLLNITTFPYHVIFLWICVLCRCPSGFLLFIINCDVANFASNILWALDWLIHGFVFKAIFGDVPYILKHSPWYNCTGWLGVKYQLNYLKHLVVWKLW